MLIGLCLRICFSSATRYLSAGCAERIWLRTNGVRTNGAAAKVRNFDRWGKKVHFVTFGKIRVG